MKLLSNKEVTEILKQTVKANPVCYGIDLSISFDKDVILDDHHVLTIKDKLIKKINASVDLFNDVVGGFIKVNIVEYSFYHFEVFLILNKEITDPVNFTYVAYNELSAAIENYKVHVQSFMDAMNMEYMEFLKMPFSNNLHDKLGMVYARTHCRTNKNERVLLLNHFTKE